MLNHALTAANGTEITVSGEVSSPFTLGKHEGVIKGLVTEHVVARNWLAGGTLRHLGIQPFQSQDWWYLP